MNEKLSNPPRIYGGLDLYMINDALEDDVLREQIREFYDKGCYSVIARTYNGLKSDYPGEIFMGKMAVILDEAKKVGLKIALQAGYMPAACPDLPEDCILSYINPVKTAELKGDESIICTHGEWSYTEQINPYALNMFSKKAVERYVEDTYGKMWRRFEHYFGNTVIGVWVDEPRYKSELMPCCPDMRRDYMETYGESLDENIYMLYENEGDYKRLRYRFYTLMEKKMEEAYFATVRDWCHSKGLQFCGHLMAEDYVYTQIGEACANMPFYRYFDIPGIDILRTEQNWAKMPKSGVEYMRRERITGGGKPNAPAAFELDHMMYQPPRQLVSAALQAGKEHMLCEMFAVTSPDLNFRDQMHLFDFFAVHGINHQCCHAMFYSIKGFRKRFYPQQFNTYQPFWTNFGNVKSYVKRVSNFVSMGTPTTDCLVLHPIDTCRQIYRVKQNKDSNECMREAYEYDERFFKLQSDLSSLQLDFHLGDQNIMSADGSVDGSLIKVGRMSYKTLVLSEIDVLRRPVFELILKFAQNGGEVLISRGIPTRIDGEISGETDALAGYNGVKIFDNNAALLRYMSEKEKDFEYVSDSDVSSTLISHRTDGNSHYLMVFNRDGLENKAGELVLVGKHTAIRYNALDGSEEMLDAYFKDGKTHIPFTNAAGGSTLIYTLPASSLPDTAKKAGAVTSLPLSPKSLRLHDKNLMTLEYCSYKLEGDEEFSEEIVTERIIEILRDIKYDGEITMRFKFISDHEARGVGLVCEEPELCKISLNGVPVDNRSVGYHYERGFEILNLPDVIREGENVIEITRHNEAVVSARLNAVEHLFELFRTPKGTDLERIHLIGDFYVKAYAERGASAHTKISRHTVLSKARPIKPTSDITRQGYPFWVGSLTYDYEFSADSAMLSAGSVSLKVGKYGVCTASVEINGKAVGSIDRNPYSLPIKDYLKEGNNEIRIIGYTTLRNAIGPMHTKDREVGGCSKPEWYSAADFNAKGDFHVIDRDTAKWVEGYQLVPTGIGEVTVETE